jgi:hypothetical protein
MGLNANSRAFYRLTIMRTMVLAGLLIVPTSAFAEETMRVSADGVVLRATVVEAEKLDALELEHDAKQVTKLKGWTAISGQKTVPALLQRCERYVLTLQPQQLDKRKGARVDIACANGEDMYTANAMTILVETLEPYHVLWLGEGDRLTSENDACVTEHLVEYALKGKTLTQKITDRSRANKDGSCTPGGKRGKPKIKQSTKTIQL